MRAPGVAVVGMRELDGRPAQQFVLAETEHFAKRAIYFEVHTLERSVRDADGRLVERGAKPLFAFLDCCFGRFALGNVDDRADQTGDVATGARVSGFVINSV